MLRLLRDFARMLAWLGLVSAASVAGMLTVVTLAAATSALAAQRKLVKPEPPSSTAVAKPIPDLKTLMQEVVAHQKELETIRENYTYRELTVTEDVDPHGKVMKTESEEDEVFFVNGHEIDRVVQKNGKPLTGADADKEQKRVTKQVEKAEKVPSDRSLQNPNQTITVGKMLEIMQVTNPRRVEYNGRSTLEFDLAGRHDAKTHGIAEGAMKKIAGSIWIDEQDRQVAHLEVRFTDNFHLGGGLLANIEKGTEFRFDQGLVNGEIWLPTGGEIHVTARLMLLKGVRQHLTIHDWDYKRFHVDAEQQKSAAALQDPKR